MASEHLIKITNKAKQLRRANPKLKWTDAVKKASKLIKPAAKKAAPKKRAVAKKVSGVKKSAPKKAAAKTHKDTKSHNVNIRVVSGVRQKEKSIKEYIEIAKRENDYLEYINYWKRNLKTAKTPIDKAFAKERIKSFTNLLKAVKQQKAIQKKLI